MKLINKDAVVAEIERLVNNQDSALDYEAALEDVHNFINTLEVKMIDIEEEITLMEDKYHGFESLSRADIVDVAKHFFELGMAVSNKAQKGG